MARRGGDSTGTVAVAVGLAIAVAGIFAVGWLRQWPLMLPLLVLSRAIRYGMGALYVAASIGFLGAVLAGSLERLARRRSGDQGAVAAPASLRWRLLISWTLGCAAIIVLGIILLAAGIYHAWLWQVVALVANLGGLLWASRQRWRPIRRLWSEIGGAAGLERRLRTATTPWNLVIGALLAAALLHALLPPSTRDELVYHLAMPRLWELQHDWWMSTDNYLLMFPATIELIWGYALAVTGEQGPRLVTWIFGVLTLLLIDGWWREQQIGAWARRVSVLFFLATPMLLISLGICYVEWPLVFFLLIGWLACRRFVAAPSAGAAVVGAVALAVAAGAKYSVLPVVALLGLEWLVRVGRARRHLLMPALAVLVLASLFIVAPWAWRNMKATGDPLFPLGVSFGIARAHVTVTGAATAREMTHYQGMGWPWRAYPPLFHMTTDRTTDHRLHPGWLFLHLAVLGAGWRSRRDLPWATVVVTSAWLLLFTPAPRIYVPLLALLWLFLPVLLAGFAKVRAARGVIGGTVALLVLSAAPFAAHHWFMGYDRAVQDYLVGLIDEREALRRDGLITPVMAWIKGHTEREARLWLWGGDAIFHFERWVRPSAPYGRPPFLAILEASGSQALSEAIATDGIAFVVIDTTRCRLDEGRVVTDKAVFDISAEVRGELKGWMRDRLELVGRDQRFELYRVSR